MLGGVIKYIHEHLATLQELVGRVSSDRLGVQDLVVYSVDLAPGLSVLLFPVLESQEPVSTLELYEQGLDIPLPPVEVRGSLNQTKCRGLGERNSLIPACQASPLRSSAIATQSEDWTQPLANIWARKSFPILRISYMA